MQDGLCIKIFEVPTSWQGAEDACIAVGAHLARVTTQGQNNWISSNIQAHTWISATDQFIEQDWVDSMGNDLSFTPFYGHPAGRTSYNCGVIWHAYASWARNWQAQNCNNNYHYACGKSRKFPTFAKFLFF